MDKYTKALIMFFRTLIGIFCILVGVSLIGISFWISTFSDVASMIFIISLLGGGSLINFGIGYAFLHDQYKATNIVRDGDTMYTPVKSTKFLKRRKIVTFIGFISYILLAVYYIARIIIESIYYGHFQEIGYSTSIIVLIIFIIIALICAFCFYMLYKKTKHIDLNEK